MSYDVKVADEEQKQRTYENAAEARRVITVDELGATRKTIKSAIVDVTTSGDNIIVAAVTGKRIKVCAFSIQSTAVTTVSTIFKDGAATDLTGAYEWKAREGLTSSISPNAFLFATSAGNALILNLSAATQVVGHVTYWDDDAT